ncbi:hypothetical protein SAMN04488104_102912 [Algoriphagus faecimaris]|uniref:Uncharacterized protein n=1 Tax=Algoriphagus faecimaris TaxID=686796 RepID=A0A1G6UL39_9BACT|nr:hypothetical protein SAMN04488104_102912 [Algoriphagus faecimaris]
MSQIIGENVRDKLSRYSGQVMAIKNQILNTYKGINTYKESVYFTEEKKMTKK